MYAKMLPAALLLAAAAGPAFGQAAGTTDPGVKVGVLTCESVPGTRLNLLVHSTVDIVCAFETPSGTERYKGETGVGLGVDLSWKSDQRISFAVVGPTSDVRPGAHALAGKYVGAEASATAGVGAGAKVLAGGGEKSFTLQPLAVETSRGLGLSAGVSYLYLEPLTEPLPQTATK